MNDFNSIQDNKRVAIAKSIAKNVSERDERFYELDIFAHLINYFRLPELNFDQQSDLAAEILKDNPEKYKGLWNERLQVMWDSQQKKSPVDLFHKPGANN